MPVLCVHERWDFKPYLVLTVSLANMQKLSFNDEKELYGFLPHVQVKAIYAFYWV